jgi:hypothetical protein
MKTPLNKFYFSAIWIMAVIAVAITGCSGSSPNGPTPPKPPADSSVTGSMPDIVAPDIDITMHGTKISQLIGDYDREEKRPTLNKTYTRYHLENADLGVPFRYNNRTYLLFGDSHSTSNLAAGDQRDAFAWTTDSNPDNGLRLHFFHDKNGHWKPVNIPGIAQGSFDVPMEGVEVDGKMYIYATTGHTAQKTMGRSVVARSDTGGADFQKLYAFSSRHFINVSVVKTSFSNVKPSSSSWKLLPKNKSTGTGLVIFGSGKYRKSNVYLAYQPASKIENSAAVRYFSGVNKEDKPLWSSDEFNAVALFKQPCVGELSVTFNSFINRWIMLYNCGNPRGINIRTAKNPWGPWTKPQVLFDPGKDGGYCHFMHVSWKVQKCDSVQDPGREDVYGGEYGPYQYTHYAKGSKGSTTIYFNMSTWNPYTVVLMKAKLKRAE